jgi:hypothetical protein
MKPPAPVMSDASPPMPNRWNIPAWLEREVVERDRSCIYCGFSFALASVRRERPSWEHIVNDAEIVTRENIALCCIGCNASKGTKSLDVWLRSRYCLERGISPYSIAAIARSALAVQAAEILDDADRR